MKFQGYFLQVYFVVTIFITAVAIAMVVTKFIKGLKVMEVALCFILGELIIKFIKHLKWSIESEAMKTIHSRCSVIIIAIERVMNSTIKITTSN